VSPVCGCRVSPHRRVALLPQQPDRWPCEAHSYIGATLGTWAIIQSCQGVPRLVLLRRYSAGPGAPFGVAALASEPRLRLGFDARL
jgi:hypothetical protein